MKINKLKVYDLEESIAASKYPMLTDVYKATNGVTKTVEVLGNAKSGSGHDSFLKGIRVSFDLTFTNKAWVEAERYTFFDIVSSQSTMHKITKMNLDRSFNKYVWKSTIKRLELMAKAYNDLKDKTTEEAKEMYLTILYNTPSGLELTARISTNYLQLKTIYWQRKNHRLPEWKEFCKEIEKLPYFKELCLTK